LAQGAVARRAPPGKKEEHGLHVVRVVGHEGKVISEQHVGHQKVGCQ